MFAAIPSSMHLTSSRRFGMGAAGFTFSASNSLANGYVLHFGCVLTKGDADHIAKLPPFRVLEKGQQSGSSFSYRHSDAGCQK